MTRLLLLFCYAIAALLLRRRRSSTRPLLRFRQAVVLAFCQLTGRLGALSSRWLEKGWARMLGCALVVALLVQQFVRSFVLVTDAQLRDTRGAPACDLEAGRFLPFYEFK